ncbi:hypothetical protein [Vagococcus luciliae]|uniref:Uncharacterized protein n=1 Tax=Vagococcus luciliae TaxID=2920380 RepID=A0ABY5P180_9ENTE|nr:hypothetical protein [Vagococcus luciliae]UUV99573.1 hypothetical protein G314FT_17340 [Vagococcus luciliae]
MNYQLSQRLKTLEKIIHDKQGTPLLFIDLNEDRTYGENNWTKKELDQHIEKNNYKVVFIDDVPTVD